MSVIPTELFVVSSEIKLKFLLSIFYQRTLRSATVSDQFIGRVQTKRYLRNSAFNYMDRAMTT